MLMAALLVAGGCGGDVTDPAPGAAEREIESAGFGPAGGVDWPGGIPSDIPVLDGEITNTMSDSFRLRMFYTGVSDRSLIAYLETLEAAGYELDFVVYETPGSGDRAEERAAAGEWDAVRATKGQYRLGLEFGGGTGVFDISGIPMDGFGPETSWPEQWAGVPAPTGMTVNEVIDLGMNGPLVEVGYETDADIEAYVEELQAVGFAVINRAFDQNDNIISVTVADAVNEVELRTYPEGRLDISVSASTGEMAQSVSTREFPEWLPGVPGGEIATASTGPDGSFNAVVTIAEGHTVAEYVQLLFEAGFVETETMLAGYILSDGQYDLTIYGYDDGFAPLQIMIQVDP